MSKKKRMTIDEAIKIAKAYNGCANTPTIDCEGRECETCDYYLGGSGKEDIMRFLPDWLEELKELRACVKTPAYEAGYKKGRTDAIDESILEINKLKFAIVFKRKIHNILEVLKNNK